MITCCHAEKIDEALFLCGSLRKPVYLEIACNLTTHGVAPPAPVGREYFCPKFHSDSISLNVAANAVLKLLNETHVVKPVLIAGAKLRSADAVDDFAAFANALGCGVAVMPDAKGLFSETNAQYMGCYWVGVSARHVQEVVESADLIICAGAVLNDYTTVGWTALLPPNKTVLLGPTHVDAGGKHYPQVGLKAMLRAMAEHPCCPRKEESIHQFRRYSPQELPRTQTIVDVTAAKDTGIVSPLSLRFLLSELQTAVTQAHVASLVVEVGDSWFMGQKLRLPDGVKYHVQMQYGSCGWALGACLGAGMALSGSAHRSPTHRGSGAAEGQTGDGGGRGESKYQGVEMKVMALIGDGSFQFTAQELSTLIRNQVNVTILLMNNQTYTIEVQIHDGAYNRISEWKYAELVDVLNGEGACSTHAAQQQQQQQEQGKTSSGVAVRGVNKAIGVRARTNEELLAALDLSATHTGVLLIECCLSKDDCTSSLLEWGSRVANANMR